MESNDDSIEINNLRGSLHRRNQLLDVIRKAYHRDVLVVKEYLKQKPLQESSFLDSLPSVDLRETFRLFAPEGCELRVRPCLNCGGQLELIHNESSRILDFKQSLKSLEENVASLQLELVDTKVKAQEDRDRLVAVKEKNKEEQDVLIQQTLLLEHQVADRYALNAEILHLQNYKISLESRLQSQYPMLVDRERLVVENQTLKDESRQFEAKYKEEVNRGRLLQSTHDALSQQISLLEQQNSQLRQDIAKAHDQIKKSDDKFSSLNQDLINSKDFTNKIEACLHTAQHAIGERVTDHQLQKRMLTSQIKGLESKCSDLGSTISALEAESKMNAAEAARLGDLIQSILEGARSKGLIEVVPRDTSVALAKADELICDADRLRRKYFIVSQLLLSSIRSSYENCLANERLLADNNAELCTNDQKLERGVDPINEKVATIIEHLERSDASDCIDWVSILEDEKDRRHIIGNLNNRLQMGQFSLVKAFQKIHQAHTNSLRDCRDVHKQEVEGRRLIIWELEKMLHSSNSKYDEVMLRMHKKYGTVEAMLDSIRCNQRMLRTECQSNNDIILMLRKDQCTMNTCVNRLLIELNESKALIRDKQAKLDAAVRDVSDRDIAIQQLESMFESTTHRYAENERRRIKITHEMAIQAISVTSDASSHVDFLPSLPDSSKCSSDSSLIPGRVFKVDSENWPSRINVSYNSTKSIVSGPLQYRRALDKL